MAENMSIWNRFDEVPACYTQRIGFGNLKGKSDINPQWRIKAMTEVFGACGDGWKHDLTWERVQECPNGEVMLFVRVEVVYRVPEGFSAPVVGYGGDFLVNKNKNGLVPNDEAYKMAYTDALGNALKSLGVASKVYEGSFDGSKYISKGYAVKPLMPDDAVPKAIEWAIEKGISADQAIESFSTKYIISEEQKSDIVKGVCDAASV